MSAKDEIRIRAERAFSDGELSEEAVREILVDLRTSQRDLEQRMRHKATTIAVLAAVFLLLLSENISEVSVTFVKLKNFGPIIAVLPVVISYLGYSYVAHLWDTLFFGFLHDQIIKVRFPILWHNDIEMFLTPSTSVIHRSYRLELLMKGRVGRLYAFTTYVVHASVVIVAPVPLLAYAYLRISELTGVPGWLSAGSLAISIAIVVMTLIELLLPLVSDRFTREGWRTG